MREKLSARELRKHEGFRRLMHEVERQNYEGARIPARYVRQMREYFAITPYAPEPAKLDAQACDYKNLEQHVDFEDLDEGKLYWQITDLIGACLDQMVLAVDTGDRAWFETLSEDYARYMQEFQALKAQQAARKRQA